MARSPVKALSESDVAPAAEETLDFDDVTLRGEKKHVCYFTLVVDTLSNVTPVAVSKHCSFPCRAARKKASGMPLNNNPSSLIVLQKFRRIRLFKVTMIEVYSTGSGF